MRTAALLVIADARLAATVFVSGVGLGSLFEGQRLPQVGAITMDQLVLDATNCPGLEVGSVVTLLGQEGREQITPTDWSDRCQTIPWEILCGFKHRLPRLTAAQAAWEAPGDRAH